MALNEVNAKRLNSKSLVMLRLYILPSLENTNIEVAAPYPPLVIALTDTLYGVSGTKEIAQYFLINTMN